MTGYRPPWIAYAERCPVCGATPAACPALPGALGINRPPVSMAEARRVMAQQAARRRP